MKWHGVADMAKWGEIIMNRRLAIIVILSAVAIELLLQGMVWRIEAVGVDWELLSRKRERSVPLS